MKSRKATVQGELVVGNPVGTYMRMSNLGNGMPWYLLGSSGDYTKLTGYVNCGVAWDPSTGATTEFNLPMTKLEKIVIGVGPSHDEIGSKRDSKSPRGAFWLVPVGGYKQQTQSRVVGLEESWTIYRLRANPHITARRGEPLPKRMRWLLGLAIFTYAGIYDKVLIQPPSRTPKSHA